MRGNHGRIIPDQWRHGLAVFDHHRRNGVDKGTSTCPVRSTHQRQLHHLRPLVHNAMSDADAKPQNTVAQATNPDPNETVDADKSKSPASPASPASQVIKAASETPAVNEANSAPAEPTPIAQLWSLAQATGHPEVWGVTLADPESHIPTRIILQKYLNANDGDLAKAKDQLTKTLEWRAKMKPLELAQKIYSKAKFEGLGFVTTYREEGSTEPEGKEVFTWNIYGGVKSIDETFGKLEEQVPSLPGSFVCLLTVLH